jgi:hypothetical protein
VGAEGGHLDHLVLAAAAVHHVHDAKTPPDDEGATKQALDLLGRGVGGHVKILRPQAHQQVAHGATHDVGLVARLLERAHHVGGPFVDQGGIDAVNLGGDFLALAERVLLAAACGRFAEELVDKLLDHEKVLQGTQTLLRRTG